MFQVKIQWVFTFAADDAYANAFADDDDDDEAVEQHPS